MFMPSYCERDGTHLMSAEPLNLFSNLAFILAGVLIFKQASASARPQQLKIFAGLVMLIGLGSASFHAWATPATLILDITAIGLTVVYYVLIYLNYVFKCQLRGLIGGVAVLVALSVLIAIFVPNELTNGSSDYLGVWMMMVLLAGADPSARRHMWIAVGIFSAALIVRTLDQPWCEWLPYGIHFLWHCANAWLLYHLARRFHYGHTSR